MSTITDVSAIVGLIGQAAGTVQQFKGSAQQYKAAKDLLKDAETEMGLILREGDVLARNARQRASQANDDLGFLRDQIKENIDTLRQQGARIEGRIIAQTAGRGLALTGSPLLAAAEATLQTERAIANQRLTQTVGERRFRFEIEKELQAAVDAQEGAYNAARGVGELRASQAGAIRQSAGQARVQALMNIGSALNNKGTQELIKGLMPAGSTTGQPLARPSNYNAAVANRLSAGQDGI